MIELSPSHFPLAAPLFQQLEHSSAIVYAVLEQNSPGRVFVDHPHTPTLALLYAQDAFFYVAGDENSPALHTLAPLICDDLLPQMEEKELVLFSFTEAWCKKLEFLQERGAIRIRRKVFRFDQEKFAIHRAWRARIPEGYRMQAIDATLAARFPAYKPIIDPVSKRFGVCLMKGEEVASVCSAVFVGHGEAEIDIHTDERERGRGFATLTASAFIETCLARGLRPNWACWPERKASWALALKLGFGELPDVPAFLWAEEM